LSSIRAANSETVTIKVMSLIGEKLGVDWRLTCVSFCEFDAYAELFEEDLELVVSLAGRLVMKMKIWEMIWIAYASIKVRSESGNYTLVAATSTGWERSTHVLTILSPAPASPATAMNCSGDSESKYRYRNFPNSPEPTAHWQCPMPQLHLRERPSASRIHRPSDFQFYDS
jgi:hypothetical protein